MSGSVTQRFVSRLTTGRIIWGAVAVVAFLVATVAAVVSAVGDPSVPSVVLALIVTSLAAMTIVLAIDAVGQGILRVGPNGYATHLTREHPWSNVLAIGTAQVEGRPVPVVALRATDGFVVNQDVLRGFAADETDAVVSALRAANPDPPGFGALELDAAWWATVDAEAERAVGVVRNTAGREPVTRERVEFGFPGLVSAIRLDYGSNEAGERVELFVRQGLDLALTTHGRRWLRQHRRRGGDVAEQVEYLFADHEATVTPTPGTGFDRLQVSAPGHKDLVFNAEEPDRYAGASR